LERVVAVKYKLHKRFKVIYFRLSGEGHRLRDHHRRMLRLSLEHLAFPEQQIHAIDGDVLELIARESYQSAFDLLQSIPGIRGLTAAALLAETGADMSVFPTEGQLSSWLGVCPGQRISAGKNRSSATPRGNKWARTTLVECAWAAAAKKDRHLKERFRRLCVKGRKPALIAIAHSLAVIVHRTLSTGVPCSEPHQPAPDERQRLIRHYVRRLGKLGIAVHSMSQEPANLSSCRKGAPGGCK
jgi:transposase